MKGIKVLLVAVAALFATLALAQSTPPNTDMLRFDIAENVHQAVIDDTNLYDDGLPAHGSGFITRGYLYPAGTLDGSNGVNADGSPEFPDAVVGEWVCYGYLIGEAAHAETGAWIISTQVFNFGEGYGDATVITQGYELVDIGKPVFRAVTGGTGDYARVTGQQTQRLMGFNQTEGVVLSVELELTRPTETAANR